MTEQLVEYVENLLSSSLTEHRRRKDVLRRASWALHIGALLASSCVTVLLGVRAAGELGTWLRNLALAAGAVGTILTALLSYWNLDNYWLQRKVILNQLTSLDRQFRYLRASQSSISEAQLRAVFDEYERILGRHSDYWEAALSETQGTPPVSLLPRTGP